MSNFPPSRVRTLPTPLEAHQVEISLTHRAALEDGTLDQCQEYGFRPMAWSPLGTALNLPAVDQMADKYDASPAQIALSWLLKHPSGIIPVVGTTTPSRIAEAAESPQIVLSREDWYTLLTEARGERLP